MQRRVTEDAIWGKLDDLLHDYEWHQKCRRETGNQPPMANNRGLADRQRQIQDLAAIEGVRFHVGARWNDDGLRGEQFQTQLKSDVDGFLERFSAKLNRIVVKEHIHILKWEEIVKAAHAEADRQVQRPDLCGPGPSLWVDGNAAGSAELSEPPSPPKATPRKRPPRSPEEAESIKERAKIRQAFVGPILRKKRKNRSWLATESGAGRATVHGYWNGTRAWIDPDNRQAIAEVLGIREVDLPR